tara:strand:+ start:249 stop:1073 length:825 start_codon:yes stop_codon:yes gene_type:complete
MTKTKIYKPKELEKFTAIPNQIFRSKGISMQATGIYCWLFSHKPGHGISVSFIAGHFKNGRDAVNTALKELQDHGWLIKKEIRSNGKYNGYELHLTLGKPVTGKPITENPKQSNINNTTINNIIDNKYENILPHFVKLFPTKYQPRTTATKNKWIKCLDQIERIDKYDLREVYKICQFFRSHDFWSDNFQTLLKLRNKDKNGLKYIDRFADLYNKESKPGSFNKIKGLEFFYLDENFNLFAKTKSGLLTEFHLKQLLSQKDIIEITKYLRSGKK